MQKFKPVNAPDLEDIEFELQCGTDIVQAIQTAMAEAPCSSKNMGNALFGAWMLLDATIKKLNNLYITKETET